VTPQEQQLLKQLTDRINQTQLQEKDPDAENMLGRELGANPDALYIMAQTVLVQNIALEQARAQVNDLQQQLQQRRQQPAHATSFLGRLLGEKEPQPVPPPLPQQQWSSAPPSYQPAPQYAPPPPQYAPLQYQQPQYVPTGQPSFLRGAMQTAAGVAAGALAFEGVESILHGFGHGGGYGMGGFGMGPSFGMGGGGFGQPVEETVINNYYDAPHTGGAPGAGGLAGLGGERHETADQGGAHFEDTGYDTSGSDQSFGEDMGGNDDLSNYDTASNDTSGFDDGGGGFDDGGGDLSV
jgi:hypothetical protein